MGVDAVYLLDEKKRIRRAIVWSLYELIHDEGTYTLTAEIASGHGAKPGEFLAFYDVDGRLRLFEIDEAEKDETRGVTAITATDAAVAELAHRIVPEIRLENATAEEAAQAAVAGSGWEIGRCDETDKRLPLGAYRETRWKVLRGIASDYGLRAAAYFEIENGEIAGRRVDMTARESVFRGRIFEGGGQAKIYVARSGAPVTRMYGVGRATGTEDPPSCVTIADAQWSKANGDPADKPKGQSYIEDTEATAMYGEGREGVYTDKNETDPQKLLEATWAELQKKKRPKVSGTATASDLEGARGYAHMAVRLYDRVYVRTRDGEDVKATVIGVKRNYLRGSLTRIEIGEEAQDVSLVKKVAALSRENAALRGSSSASANRYIETKQLIQLNADTIQMNARLIEANAEKIRLLASNVEAYQEGTDERLTKAELTLYGDGTSANAGLAATVESQGEEISRAALTLYGDGTSANAGLVAGFSDQAGRLDKAELTLYGDGTSSNAGLAATVESQGKEISRAALTLYGDGTSANAGLTAKVNDHEAAITLHADELGTLAEVKADKVDLGKYATVTRLEAEIAEVKITESSYVTTAGLNTQSLGANFVDTNTFALAGNQVTLKSTEYVKSVGRTKRYALSPSNITIEFYEISSVSTGTLYYLAYGGG